MFRRNVHLLFAAVILTAITIPSWAADNGSSSLTAKIKVSSNTNLSNNTTLAPGDYKVTREGNQAKFEKDGNVVAEVPCTVKTLPAKASQTQVRRNGDRLEEIQISGKTEAIEFSSNQS